MSQSTGDPLGTHQPGPKVPFDARFFMTVLPDRIQATCPGEGAHIPVVLLDLADGRRLDLCHIDLLTPEWMSVAAFGEKVSCDEMDVVFVPYEMIALVTVSKRNPSQRSVGFQIEKAPEWRKGGMGEGSLASKKHACKSEPRPEIS